MSIYAGWDVPRPGWTCPECGLRYHAITPAAVGALLEALLPEYAVLFEADDEQLRRRPDPDTWSALEYACHVRDCLALYDWRIRRVLAEEHPYLPQMRRDAIAVERAYNDQDPALVAQEMAANCDRLAQLLPQVSGPEWQRFGVREGDPLSVAWMAVNVDHEVRHHLMDVERVLTGTTGQG